MDETEIKMNNLALRTLARLLGEFEDEEFDALPGYSAGEWSRRNLSALIEDVEKHAASRVT